MLKVVDISPGAGGMALGFLNSGRFVVRDGSVLANTDERHTFTANINSDGVPIGQVMAGSFPREFRPDAVHNLMCLHEPMMFLFELPEASYFHKYMFKGYHTESYVLDAVEYHVPQRRKRTWLVGARNDLVYPNHTLGTPEPKGWPFTVSETMFDLPLTPGMPKWPRDQYHTGMDLHSGKRISDITEERFDAIPPGGDVSSVPFHLRTAKYQKDNLAPSEVLGRLDWNAPAREILPELNPEKGRFLHPNWTGLQKAANQNRVLTMLECARLQTFPDTYSWYGSKVSVMKQIGTATPPKQAQAWAHFLADELEG